MMISVVQKVLEKYKIAYMSQYFGQLETPASKKQIWAPAARAIYPGTDVQLFVTLPFSYIYWYLQFHGLFSKSP